MKKKKIIINNGRNETFINEGEDIPEGWVKGRLKFSDETKKKIGGKRTGKIHVHKGDISKVIDLSELQTYLNNGYERGRAKFSKEAIDRIRQSRKRFFEQNPHWTNETSWKSGNKPWNEGIPMSEEAKEKLSNAKTGVHYSEEQKAIKNKKEQETRIKHSGSLENSYKQAGLKSKDTIKEKEAEDPSYKQNIVEKRKKTCLDKYGCESSSKLPEVQRKRRQTNKGRYGVEIASKNEKIKKKICDTKRKNHSFSSSAIEESFYELLLKKFDKNDIERQYMDERYPFACDFYIKSLDMFIELNIFWTHGSHPFNPNNENDKNRLEYIRSKQSTYLSSKGIKVKNQFYTVEDVWVHRDPLKLAIAKKNNLNYITIYNKGDMYDFIRRI